MDRKARGEEKMSTFSTKTTRKGKAIVVTLTQDDDRDRISVTVDGEPLSLDEEANAGRPVSVGAKLENNMGLEPRGGDLWDRGADGQRVRCDDPGLVGAVTQVPGGCRLPPERAKSPRLITGTPVRTLPRSAEDGPSLPQQGTVG